MTMDSNGRRQGSAASSGEDQIEVGRYLEAVRRSRWMIVAIVVVVTGAVLAFSLKLPKTYEATASIVVDNASGLVTSNEQQTIQRNLQTTATLATTASVRARAATEPSIAAQLTTLQARAAELEAASARAGSELQLLQRPSIPSSASSPRPLRNVVIALFASIFLGVLLALGREQLTPRV